MLRVTSRVEIENLSREYIRTGSPSVRERLVASQLRLVMKIARQHSRGRYEVDDLINEGVIGLIHAVEKYNPDRGVSLTVYAAWWIRAYVRRFILENYRLVRFGTTNEQRKLFSHEARVRARLEAALYGDRRASCRERV